MMLATLITFTVIQDCVNEVSEEQYVLLQQELV